MEGHNNSSKNGESDNTGENKILVLQTRNCFQVDFLLN